MTAAEEIEQEVQKIADENLDAVIDALFRSIHKEAEIPKGPCVKHGQLLIAYSILKVGISKMQRFVRRISLSEHSSYLSYLRFKDQLDDLKLRAESAGRKYHTTLLCTCSTQEKEKLNARGNRNVIYDNFYRWRGNTITHGGGAIITCTGGA